MTIVLGLDIGGANTKFAILEYIEGKVSFLSAESEYFPLWRQLEKFPDYLTSIKEKIEKECGVIDYTVFVTTAELADCFQTKKEGIETISTIVEDIFTKDDHKPLIYDVNGEFHSTSKTVEKWLEVSATNWVASANFLGKEYPNAIILDIGSTTTDIIPIFNGKVVAKGKNDFERLASYELVYSGTLRTTIPAIAHKIKLRGKIVPVSSELFATSGDVYLLLDMISENEFIVDTADGRPPTKENALARLARTVCADHNQLSTNEIMQIAKQIKEKQFNILSVALNTIIKRFHTDYEVNPKIILIGSGSEVIGISLLRENGIYEQILINEIINTPVSTAFSAYATANLFIDTLKIP
ncbi:MAG: hydantoinase/oxoprolinase family protein [Candidatus Heimdallarchaeota archaeon]